MWNIRRKIEVSELPRRKVVVQFILTLDGKSDRNYWLIVRPDGATDLCQIDPKFNVDLYVSASLRALTSVWMGHSSFAQEIAREQIVMIGDKVLARSMPRWLQRSSFAVAESSLPDRRPSERYITGKRVLREGLLAVTDRLPRQRPDRESLR